MGRHTMRGGYCMGTGIPAGQVGGNFEYRSGMGNSLLLWVRVLRVGLKVLNPQTSNKDRQWSSNR